MTWSVPEDRAMADPLVATERTELKLSGKKVLLAGRFSWYREDRIKAVVLSEGGEIVTEIADDVYCIVVGADSRGTPNAVREAEKRMKKGWAQIAIVDEAAFYDFLIPDRAELTRLFRAGDANRLSLFLYLKAPAYSAAREDLSGLDLRGCVYDGYQMQQLNLDKCLFDNSTLKGSYVHEITGASFKHAKVVCSTLNTSKECQFQGAEFQRSLICIATKSDFTDCKFETASLTDGRLEESLFVRTSFKGVRFFRASFSGCDFSSSDWLCSSGYKATFFNCKFNKASLTDSWLLDCIFRNCDFSGCDLSNSNFALSAFENCKIDGANFTGTRMGGVKHDFARSCGATGLQEALDEGAGVPDVGNLQEVQDLNAASLSGSTYEVRARFQRESVKVLCTVGSAFRYQTGSSVKVDFEGHASGFSDHEIANAADLMPVSFAREGFHLLRCALIGFTLEAESIEAKLSRGKVSAKDFKALAINALCRSFGMEPPSARELKKLESTKKAEASKEKDELIALLKSGAAGRERFQELVSEKKSRVLKKIDLTGCDLRSFNLASFDMRGGNFSNAGLKDSTMSGAKLCEAVFANADLDGADCQSIDASGADFSGATMCGVNFSRAQLSKARFVGANCSGVDFTGAVLNGADFTGANLNNVKFDNTVYNEKTILPQGIAGARGLLWGGAGIDPGKMREVLESAPSEPLDFASFLSRLENSVDKERLKKAIKMLQAERFQLFAELKPGSMIGVVKSQTDADLVYSCRLTDEGKFCCGTQNLNSCGGLRGALCKHLLVLLLGLTKAGQLDATVADTWARASKLQDPKMEKDIMSETFLRYKGAEAGEIDWRPTETIPEDYYAF